MRWIVPFVCFISLAVAPALAQDTTGVGALSGVVRDAAHAPVPFATVCLSATLRCVVTDASGAFRLGDVRPGEYRLEIAAPGQAPIESDVVDVRAGVDRHLEISVPVDRLQQSVTVTGSAVAAPVEVKNSGFLIEPRAITADAGALQDVSRYVQSLPGVVIGSDDFRNDIIVRGGSPLENLFVVDNVEVPNINTFANFASAGGTVSILDADMIGDVTFLTGGYPSPYINRTSSVLQIAQREGARGGFGGRATVGFAGAGGIFEGPLGGGKGSWIVSARRSFLDLFTQDVGVGGVPVLYTFNAKVVYDLGPRDRIWIVNLSGVDTIRLGLTDSSERDKEISNFDIRYSGSRSATGFNWQHVFGDRAVGLLGVSHSEARVSSAVKDLVRFGAPPPGAPPEVVIAAGPTVYSDDSREGETTAKYDATVSFADGWRLQTGGSLKLFGLRYDTSAPYGYDNPYSVVRNQDAFFLDQRFVTTQTGAYAQATRDMTRRLNLTFGARFDNYAFISASRVSPRAGASYRLTDHLSANASAGIYYQQPAYLFLSVFPQNRSLTPIRAEHYVGGLTYATGGTWKVTLEAYRKNYSDYPVAAEYPSVSLANLGDTFNVQEVLFPMTSSGTGHSEGIEAYLENRFGEEWFGQANLAFSRTRHAGLDSVLRPGAFDYPVVFNATGGRRFGQKWQVSGRVSMLSGRPYTPFDTALSTAQRRGIYDLAQIDALRAAAYVRVDLRAERTFTVAGSPVVVYAGVQNLTGRENFAGYIWNRSTNTAETRNQMGRFPILGLDWRF